MRIAREATEEVGKTFWGEVIEDPKGVKLVHLPPKLICGGERVRKKLGQLARMSSWGNVKERGESHGQNAEK